MRCVLSDPHSLSDTLVRLLKSRATKKNVTFPANFSLVVVSLNNDLDGEDFKNEREWFKSHASLGKLVNWPLGLAGIVPPHDVPKKEREKMANGSVWKIDKIPERGKEKVPIPC